MKSKLKILVITINMVIFSSARIVNAGDIKGNVKVLGGKGLEHVVVYIERVEGKTFSPPTRSRKRKWIRDSLRFRKSLESLSNFS